MVYSQARNTHNVKWNYNCMNFFCSTLIHFFITWVEFSEKQKEKEHKREAGKAIL